MLSKKEKSQNNLLAYMLEDLAPEYSRYPKIDKSIFSRLSPSPKNQKK